MSKRYTSLLYLCFILFAVLFFTLSFHSRLATDDYYFIGDSNKHGLFEQVGFLYMNWTGRYTATLAMNVFYNLWDLNQTPYNWLPVISLFLLCTGVFFLIHLLFDHFSIILSSTNKLILCCSFIILLFFISYDIAETWFWYCGYSSYLWSIIALVWGCAFLIYNQHHLISGTLAALCFTYIGGASELYTAIIGLLFTIWMIFLYRSEKLNFTKEHKRKFYASYLFLGLAFLILLIAPGNYLRDELFPEHSLVTSVVITSKSILKLFIIYLPARIPYILALGIPFLLCGEQLAHANPPALNFRSNALKLSISTAAILLLFYWITAYVMVETGPPRVLFFASFIITIYISILFFLIGYHQLLGEKLKRLLKRASLILLISILFIHLLQQKEIATNYSLKNDERIMLLKALNDKLKKDTLIYLPPLPPSGMLYSGEISKDTSHFTNKELRMGYSLRFHVATEKP